MKRLGITAAALLACLVGCKGDKKKDVEPAAETQTDKAAPASGPTAAGGDETPAAPALPSIGEDPSPVKICARLAAAAAAEGGEGEAKWKELAPDCEKNLAERMSSSADRYTAFADCMRDKTTFTAVMNDCKQLE